MQKLSNNTEELHTTVKVQFKAKQNMNSRQLF